jgi:hypothetical protein
MGRRNCPPRSGGFQSAAKATAVWKLPLLDQVFLSPFSPMGEKDA